MAVITKEERQEVATKLRENSTAAHSAEEMLHIICKCTVRAMKGSKGVMRVLADLIDPTCHQVIEDETQVCSVCSGDLDEGYGWDFCPWCGSRVVNVNEKS